MLSFLRARSVRPSPPQRDAQWDGRALTLRLDAALAGERVAIDLDGCFFADAPVDANGDVSFDFPFTPKAAPHATLLPHSGGRPLMDAQAMRFGAPGLVGARAVHESID